MLDAVKTNSPKPAAIVAIECEGLFGYYTYQLRAASELDHVVRAKLLLLYGDNGSGKTTIAQLLFHMLSPKDDRGHRTFLAQTKFRRFCVHFDNDSSFTAERADDCLVGPYTLTVSDASGNAQSVDVETDEAGDVATGGVDESELQAVLSLCSPTPLNIYFLSDDRVLQSDLFDDEASEGWGPHAERVVTRRFRDSIERVIVPSPSRALTVGPSVERAGAWLRRQAIQASSAGEITTSNIYTDIIKRITQTSSEATEDTPGRLDGLITSLTKLAERSTAFTTLGLSPPVPIETLSDHLQSVGPAQNELIASVLEPYVDSIASRLDAFAELQHRLSTFLDIINAFYRRKTVRITTADGIQVFDHNGDPLDVTLLSSGEKQLMLLLSNILVSTTQPSLFIIDEPELSLNVKWQRQLIDSLLSLVEGSHVQFIMATHSIELLTRHKDCVLKLDDAGNAAGSTS